MKKITAGIISVGLCSVLMVAGLKNISNVSAEDGEITETVTATAEDLEKQTGDPAADGTELIGKNADNLIKGLLSGTVTFFLYKRKPSINS